MIKINPIPAFENNYFWVIHPTDMDPAVIVVDPGDAQPVLDYLQRNSLRLGAILLTHRHQDHIGGVDELLAQYPVSVFGPPSAAMPQVSVTLEQGEQFTLGELTFEVIAVPGHTWEHIAYYVPDHKLLFCGDALFAAGCGRRFDGTVPVMWDSLQRLAGLPDDTLIYCAHEYTLSNLQFAAAVEPNNSDVIERLHQTEKQRAQGQITLPSTMSLEKQTNPFLRSHEAAVANFARSHSSVPINSAADVFGALRHIKDSW